MALQETTIGREHRQSLRIGGTVSVAQRFQAFSELLLLGLWLGSMVFFSFAVAPSAFSSLPSKHLAALLVTSTLSKVELLGLIIGPLLVLSFLTAYGSGRSLRWWTRTILALLMSGAAALSHFVITPVMVTLRDALPDNIDLVPISDPYRARFDQLHEYSVALMSAAIVAGLVLLFMTVNAWIDRSTRSRF